MGKNNLVHIVNFPQAFTTKQIKMIHILHARHWVQLL
uniref:Uncharacterized protein n=1 Tax=Anguilla anguilla TaxID=7936 RepID=A0A0E9U8V1_ANGAN